MSCISVDVAFIWTMVAVSLTDELIVCPLKEYYKSALIANKEMDKRG
jgi:CRISPR/Cas system-associated exonuclease Cas4 (RecB family)